MKFELDLALGDPRNNFLSNIDLSPYMKLNKEDMRMLKQLAMSPDSSPAKAPPPPPPRAVEESKQTVFQLNKYMAGI